MADLVLPDVQTDEIAALNQKLDYLTELLEEQRKRQEAFDDLKRDFTPIVNQMVNLAIEELDDIGADFVLEDLLYLLKRVVRNTKLWIKMMDRVEAAMDLADEAEILSTQVFNSAVETLDQLERKGYFTFMQGGMDIMERIVTEFGEEDIRALGDNIVTILMTVRNMTQPEILSFANNAVDAIREEEGSDETPSAMNLLRELSDPQVRRGLAKMINMVKSFAERPQTPPANTN